MTIPFYGQPVEQIKYEQGPIIAYQDVAMATQVESFAMLKVVESSRK